MKKLYDKFVIRLARICKTNPFGQAASVLLFGGVLLSCCGALPAGIACLAFSGLGFLFSVGKVALEDLEVQRDEKLEDNQFETEEYNSDREVIIEKEDYKEIEKTNKENDLERK